MWCSYILCFRESFRTSFQTCSEKVPTTGTKCVKNLKNWRPEAILKKDPQKETRNVPKLLPNGSQNGPPARVNFEKIAPWGAREGSSSRFLIVSAQKGAFGTWIFSIFYIFLSNLGQVLYLCWLPDGGPSSK